MIHHPEKLYSTAISEQILNNLAHFTATFLGVKGTQHNKSIDKFKFIEELLLKPKLGVERISFNSDSLSFRLNPSESGVLDRKKRRGSFTSREATEFKAEVLAEFNKVLKEKFGEKVIIDKENMITLPLNLETIKGLDELGQDYHDLACKGSLAQRIISKKRSELKKGNHIEDVLNRAGKDGPSIGQSGGTGPTF